MKKFKLFNNDYYKLLNERRKDNINISSNNEARVRSSIKKQAEIKKSETTSSFYNQFDTLMFTNSEEEPTSANSGKAFNLSRDLDFRNNYSRFAMKNMHYGMVDKEHFVHNNMQPNTSRRDFEVNNGFYQDRKLQIYSGMDQHFKHKKEVKPFFLPQKNLTHIHGAPVRTDELQTRYIPDMQKNHSDLPFENKVKVIPGINGRNQEGRNQVYRILPKTVDELRAKNDQKITYDAKKIHAIKKGEMRGPNPTLTKFKIPDHREQKFSDLIPNKSSVDKPKLNGMIKKPTGNRSTINNYVSHAKNTNKGDAPSKNKSKWKRTNKVTYMNDSQRNVSNVANKKQTNNKKSYTAYNTQRVTTNYEEKGNAHNNNMGSYAHDPNDIPLTTLRELMIHNENILGAHSTNGSKEYAFSKDMILPTTIRETTAENDYRSNVHNEHATYSKNPNDTARKTIRETTEKAQYESNVHHNEHATYSKNPNDAARKTIRETTEKTQYESNVHHNEHATYSKNPNDAARKTIRETTEKTQYESNVHHNEHATYSKNPKDKTRQTIRETTEKNNYESNVHHADHSTYAKNPNDKTRQTIRETTEKNNYESNVHHADHSTYAKNPNDKTRTTLKQTTMHSTPHMNVGNRESTDYVRTKNMKAKPTIRQTTIHSTPHMNVGNVESTDYVRAKNMKAKPTIKQTTIHSTPHMNVGNVESTDYVRTKNMKAKPTIRQTTIHSTPHMNVANIESTDYVRTKNMKAKPTIRQTTLHSTPHMNVGNVESTDYTRAKNMRARTTIKETTHLKNYTGGLTGEVEKPRERKDAENMCIDDRREILTYNRTPGGKHDGPHVVDKRTYEFKEPVQVKREYINKHRPVDRSVCDEELNAIYSRNKNKVKKIESDYRINYDYISELANNPLVNDLMHQKNTC